MEKQKIYYLSCPPGAGKTRLAVQTMMSHLLGGKDLIIYVAPTLELLREVKRFLLAKSQMTDALALKIRGVVSETDQSQGAVKLKLLALLSAKIGYHGVDRPLDEGSVILMTHKGFMSLPDNLPRKDSITVIFDEAYKFTAEFQPIKLKNSKEKKMLSSLISTNSVPIEGTNFRRFHLSVWPPAVKKMTNTKNSRKQYTVLSEVIESALNPRTDLYVQESKARHHFYEVVMPSRVFQGFKTTIIMSAFLEDTQMWHLLKNNPSVELKSLWVRKDFKPYKKRIVTETDKIRERFGRLCIFPVTQQKQPLSMFRMENGIMVPADKFDLIRASLENLGISSVRRLIELSGGLTMSDPKPEEQEALSLLRKHGAKRNPLRWYLSESHKFVEQLKAEGKVTGKVLASVNNKNIKTLQDMCPDFLQISTASHGLNKYRSSNALVFVAAIHPKPMMIALYRSVMPDYDYLKDHLADSCTQAVTRLCIRDTESETIAYAILPDLGMAELLRDKLMNRPTISMRAVGWPGMMALARVNAERKTERFSGPPEEKQDWVKKQQVAAAQKFLDKGNNRKIHSAKLMVKYYKKKLETNPTNTKWLDKLKTLEKKLEDLKSS